MFYQKIVPITYLQSLEQEHNNLKIMTDFDGDGILDQNEDLDQDGQLNHQEADWTNTSQQQYLGTYDFYGDNDHDGVYNGYDQDMDGDGVNNNVDHDPDNPQDKTMIGGNQGAGGTGGESGGMFGGMFSGPMATNIMTGGTRALGAGLVMKAINKKPKPAPRPAPPMNPMMNPNMMAQQQAVAAAQARMPGPLTGAVAGFFARRRFGKSPAPAPRPANPMDDPAMVIRITGIATAK